MMFKVFWDVATLKLTDVSQVRTAFIIRSMITALHPRRLYLNFIFAAVRT
jgi:hypothetical protein